jgi:hypothetical protein
MDHLWANAAVEVEFEKGKAGRADKAVTGDR